MAKNIAKVLKHTTDKIFIKASGTDGVEPSWVAADEIGYFDDASLKLDSKKVTAVEGGGQSIQTNTDFDLKLSSLQVLDEATIHAFKNVLCWIMVKPTGTVSATNPEIKVKNFILNTETMIDAKKGGKSVVNISGSKSENLESLVYAFVTSSTTVA